MFTEWFSPLTDIHPYLPSILKYSVGIVIFLFALVPVTIFAAIANYSSHHLVLKVSNYIHEQSQNLFARAVILKEKFSQLLSVFAENNQIRYKFEGERFQINDQKAEKIIEEIEEGARAFPEIFENRVSNGSEPYSELLGRVDEFESINQESKVNVNIPDITDESLEEDQLNRRNGITTLLLFVPLSVTTIVLNTYLLNMFFAELLPGDRISKTLGIYISHIIAFMFSAIEFGMGFLIGKSEAEKGSRRQDYNVKFILAVSVIVFLTIIEFIIYLKLSLNYAGVDIDKVSSIFTLLDAGWMSLFGPVIVWGLFLFGHQTTIGYLQYRQGGFWKRFKKELDGAHGKSEVSNKNIAAYNSTVKDALVNLGDLLAKTRDAPKEKPPESKFIENFNKVIENARLAIAELKSAVDTAKISQTVHVEPSEARKYFYQMLFLGFLSILNIYVLIVVQVPLFEGIAAWGGMSETTIYIISALEISALIFAGSIWFQTAEVEIDGEIAISKRSLLTRITLLLLLLGLLGLATYVCLNQAEPAYGALAINILCMALAVLIGTVIRPVLDALLTFLRQVLALLELIAIWLSAMILLVLYYSINLLNGIIQVFAYPSQKIFPKLSVTNHKE